MGKLLRSFQKRQSIASRIRCFLLALAMVVTMVPALGGGNSTVQAAENPVVRLYFEKPDDWNSPAFNYWNESDVEVDNGDAGNVEVWTNQSRPAMLQDESGYYYIDIRTNSISGFQIVNGETGVGNPAEKKFENCAIIDAINSATSNTAFYLLKNDDNGMSWYLDKDKNQVLPEKEKAAAHKVIIYFEKPENWKNTCYPSMGRRFCIGQSWSWGCAYCCVGKSEQTKTGCFRR